MSLRYILYFYCFPEHFTSISFYFVVYSIYTRVCTVVTHPFVSVPHRDNRKSHSQSCPDHANSRSLLIRFQHFLFSDGSDLAERKLESPYPSMRMLDNFEEWRRRPHWSRVSVSWKGAKRMERKAMMGCGWLGRGEVQGRSLSLEYRPTQWMLVTGEGDGEGRNTTYSTIGTRNRRGQW